MKSLVVGVLWIVSLWRLPSARQEPWKRALWMAFTALAAALTVSLHPVVKIIDTASCVTDLATLLKHVAGIVACAAVLEWVIALTRPHARIPRRSRYTVAVTTALTMTVLFFFIRRQEAADFTDTMAGDATATAYMLVFEFYLGIAMGLAAAMFLAAARQAPRGLLRWGLWILTAGASAGVAYAICRTAFLLLRLGGPDVPGGSHLLFTLTEDLQLTAILLILIGSSIPAISVALTARRDYRSLQALRPLWYELTTAVPHIVLGTPPTRRDDLTTITDLRVRLLRRTVEIRDASLLLRGYYVSDEDLDWARAELAALGLSGPRLDAATDAVALRAALHAKTGGQPARTITPRTSGGGGDLTGEVAWLRLIGDAFASPPVTTVTHRLTQRPTAEQP